MLERSFRTMGTEISLLVGRPLDPALPSESSVLASVERELLDFNGRLSRFLEDSELSLLNRDPREVVPASELLRNAVRAGVWGAERTNGLVDPTLLGELEAAGYRASFEGVRSAPLEQALSAAPARAPAKPNPHGAWRAIEVDDEAGTIRRPPGTRLDTGGTGKGLAADLVAARLDGYSRYAIDCGGDVRVGGASPGEEPIEIEVRHPLTGGAADEFRLVSGAVATSGLDARLWQLPDGTYAHHLIDPATGEPAWTGLICATARAPTALEADLLAKAALLSGPSGAVQLLAEGGGLIVHDDGRVQRIGPLHDPPRIRIPLPL